MENKEIINNKYLTVKDKGEGATATVFQVKDIKTEKDYAAKIFKKSNNFFLKEVEMLNSLKKVQSPYIIKIIESNISQNGQLHTGDKPYIILEYASKGELFDYIRSTSNGLKEKHCKLIFYKISKGIQACHNAGICHRDLKPQNILLDDNFLPKICDFGFAIFNDKNLKDYLGTLNYAAPEIFLKKPYDGFKVDIFSLGVVLFNLATCKFGFIEANKKDAYYKLIMTRHYEQYWNIVGKKINKKLSEEPTIPEKYVPENQIETFEEKVGKNLQNEDLLSEQMTKLNEKFNELHINHIKNTEKLNKNLEDEQPKVPQNANNEEFNEDTFYEEIIRVGFNISSKSIQTNPEEENKENNENLKEMTVLDIIEYLRKVCCQVIVYTPTTTFSINLPKVLNRKNEEEDFNEKKRKSKRNYVKKFKKKILY